MDNIYRSKDIALIILLSVSGGISSILIGYGGDLLSQIPIISSFAGQFLSGLHVFWLGLAAIFVKNKGSATVTGAIKGLIEAFLFSHIGVFAFLVSLIEGVVFDIVFYFIKKPINLRIYLAAGLSSASNIIIIQFLLLPQISTTVYFLMYLSSFISGIIFGGYLIKKIEKILVKIFGEK